MNVRSQNVNDISIISALIQQSITSINWIKHKNDNFEIFLNRFCWEKHFEKKELLRTNCILKILNVEESLVANPPKIRDQFIYLLGCLAKSSCEILLFFDNEFILNLKGSNLCVKMIDIHNKWETRLIPKYST